MSDGTPDSEVLALDLLALLLKFLSTLTSLEKIEILSGNDNQAALRLLVEARLADCTGGVGENGGIHIPVGAFEDYKRFLNETNVNVLES